MWVLTRSADDQSHLRSRSLHGSRRLLRCFHRNVSCGGYERGFISGCTRWGKEVGIIEYVYCQCRCRACQMQARVVSKYAREPSLHFFVSKMEMPPCFGLAKREHLVECRDHTDQRKDCSSINQRLIGLGVIDLVVSQKSPSLYLKCNGASSRSETTSYNPSFTLSGRHHIPLGTITLPRK
jgi:hypothetical protein